VSECSILSENRELGQQCDDDCLTQRVRYQSLTKTRRYVYRGQLHTRRTSRVIISGAEAVEQRERETQFVHLLRFHVVYITARLILGNLCEDGAGNTIKEDHSIQSKSRCISNVKLCISIKSANNKLLSLPLVL